MEHDPNEIWYTQSSAIKEAMAKADVTDMHIACIGIANQRETTIIWDRETGFPVYNAIVWQDRRTADYCEELKTKGYASLIQQKTGLVIDAYFSATKIRWILDHVKGVRERAERGELCFGTVDSWLVWKLTRGTEFITDITNASRTMLFNIHTQEWDKELLELFQIPASMMPEVKSSSEVYCETSTPVTAPTANLALGLMLDVARRITECDRKLRREGLGMKVGVLENLGINVTGKTLGIIGMGRIGKALARRANACGMEVLYHNRRQLYVEEETRLNVTYVSKEELLSQSDFVSLNAPYTPETYHIIGEAELKQMKPTAVLINTGRGPLVDEKALVQALKDGTIHGAGLDVFEFGDYPSPELLEMENVVLTPHIGTQTLETRIIMARTVCNNVIGFLEGDRPVSRVLRP